MEKQVHHHYSPENLWIVLVIVLGVAIVSAWLLLLGIQAGNPTAIVITAVVAFGAAYGLGVVSTLMVTDHVYRHEREREQASQAAFIANAKENLALLQAVAQTQAAQARASATQGRDLWGQIRQATRALSAPDNGADVVDVEPSGFTYDDELFEDME